MAEIIFMALVCAAILLVGGAWTFALRQHRLGQASIERTGRRRPERTPMNFDRDQTGDRQAALRP